MSFSGEQTFRAAVLAAEAVRQQAKSVAFIAYGFAPAGLATYKTAIADADVAYFNSVKTAADAVNDTIGNAGITGPIPGAGWTPMLTIA